MAIVPMETIKQEEIKMNTRFTDITDCNWAADFIRYLANARNDIVQGFPDGTFRPEDTVSIGEFCAMAVRAAKTPVANINNPPHWATRYVNIATGRGIRLHAGVGNPDLNAPIERQFAFNIAWRIIIPFNEDRSDEAGMFRDGRMARWNAFHDRNLIINDNNVLMGIRELFLNGGIEGRTGNTLAPRETLTRAEAAVIIARCLATDDDIEEFADMQDGNQGGGADRFMGRRTNTQSQMVRSRPVATAPIVHRVNPFQGIRIVLPRTMRQDENPQFNRMWIEVHIPNGGTGWIVEDSIEPAPVRQTYAYAEWNAMMDRLKNSNITTNAERLDSMNIMGRVLFENGYEPAFVAGVLSNILGEGSFGQFEFAGNQPYLQYFINNHDYRARFAGRQIFNVNITPQQLHTITFNSPMLIPGGNPNNYDDRLPNFTNIFGLGLIQWTNRPRFFRLLEFYNEQTDGGNRRITRPEVVTAETRMLLWDFDTGEEVTRIVMRDGSVVPIYADIPNAWRVRNGNQIDSEAAARDAAIIITRALVRPPNTVATADTRAEDAARIYRIMTP